MVTLTVWDSLGLVDPTPATVTVTVAAPIACHDGDHDGFSPDGDICGPIDCNDFSAAVNPGAIERCSNGTDDDCDGSVDQCAADCVEALFGSMDLVLAQVDRPDPVPVGQNLTYTLQVSNAGPATATGVTLVDDLPAGVTLVSAAASQGTCTAAGLRVSCALGTLAPGATAAATLVIRPGALGGISNTATVSAVEPDVNMANNSATAATTVSASADVAMTLTDSPDPVAAGSHLTYTLNVRNHGPSSASAVTVTDTLPTGVSFVSASSGCSLGSGTVRCALGDLAAGISVSRQIVVKRSTTGTISNTARVSSSTWDPNAENNGQTVGTTVTAPADLALTLSDRPDPVQVGSQLIYTLTVWNYGPASAPTVTVTDTLPTGVAFVSASSGCTRSSGTVSCQVGRLDRDRSVAWQIVVRPATSGIVSNTARVTSALGDPNAGNNAQTVRTTVTRDNDDDSYHRHDDE
jgi:uncharacterized repeat protein (TIGR01451 family)